MAAWQLSVGCAAVGGLWPWGLPGACRLRSGRLSAALRLACCVRGASLLLVEERQDALQLFVSVGKH